MRRECAAQPLVFGCPSHYRRPPDLQQAKYVRLPNGDNAAIISGQLIHLPGVNERDMDWITGRHNFTKAEDSRLLKLVEEFGRDWVTVSSHLKTRTPRQCRDRFRNYLDPSLDHREWSEEEDALLEEQVGLYGRRWSVIARVFKNRSEANVKNRWTALQNKRQRVERLSSSLERPKKTETNQGLDPPYLDILDLSFDFDELSLSSF